MDYRCSKVMARKSQYANERAHCELYTTVISYGDSALIVAVRNSPVARKAQINYP